MLNHAIIVDESNFSEVDLSQTDDERHFEKGGRKVSVKLPSPCRISYRDMMMIFGTATLTSGFMIEGATFLGTWIGDPTIQSVIMCFREPMHLVGILLFACGLMIFSIGYVTRHTENSRYQGLTSRISPGTKHVCEQVTQRL